MSERPHGGRAGAEARSLLDRLSIELADGTAVSLSESNFTERYRITAGLLEGLQDKVDMADFVVKVLAAVLDLEDRLLALEDDRSAD